MKKPLSMYLLVRGTPEHSRFVIGERGGRVWDGTGWNGDPSAGVLFARAEDAARLCQSLQREAYKDAKYTEFYSVPIQVEVRTDTHLLPSQIREWLQKAVDLQCSYGQHGNGPTEDTLILLNVNWSMLEHIPHPE